ncbi:MAG: alpha/beta hydrolase [Thermoflexales bacterium]
MLRTHGASGRAVIVLHGGPGAPGSAASLARGLSDEFRALESFQRRAGGAPLTVARHIEDLRAVVADCGDPRPALVGHSWGAMLALAYAAAHPGTLASLALVGCGTFDLASRAEFRARLDARMDAAYRQRLAVLDEITDPDERLSAKGVLLGSVYDVDTLPDDPNPSPADARGGAETWQDMLRLQQAGVYPAGFAAIDVPAIMLHGDDDPHPGEMIQASLQAWIPGLEYVSWPRCGHSPWLERGAREGFYRTLKAWLRGVPAPRR